MLDEAQLGVIDSLWTWQLRQSTGRGLRRQGPGVRVPSRSRGQV